MVNRVLGGALAIGMLFSLAACAGPTVVDASDVERDPTAKAVLDYENVQITYPLDKFSLSNEEEDVIYRAREQIIGECLVKNGQVNMPYTPSPEEDRDFGIWNVERAQRYGFAIPEETSEDQDSTASNPDLESQRQHCVDDPAVSEKLSSVTPDLWLDLALYESSVVEQVRSAAYTAASELSEWDNARSDYSACLRESGLTLNEDGWGSKEHATMNAEGSESGTAASEAEIRIAVSEATCNQQVDLTQRLADLVASYQAPLIAQNEAALQEESDDIRSKLSAAREALGE